LSVTNFYHKLKKKKYFNEALTQIIDSRTLITFN